jgi:predicted HD phosphohydrolase
VCDHAAVDRLGREGRRAEQVLVLLSTLDTVCDGGEISELAHALQVATRAERAGADDELVLAALLHDVGKVFGDAGHGPIAAALLEPHVRSDVVNVVRHHSAFTARHWGRVAPGGPDPRDQFADESWFGLANSFVDDWDMASFDAAYDSEPLAHFEVLVKRLVGGP